MKVLSRIVLFSMFITLLFACEEQIQSTQIVVSNDLNVPRKFETISLTKNFLKLDSLQTLGIRDQETKQLLITQVVDIVGDGKMDELLFQPDLAAKSSKVFEIVRVSNLERPQSETYCYSRFVPERTDDYAWENNRVAYRTYGPKAQKMFEEGVSGGTLSSGIDAWLKKEEYPIINKWYKKELETEGTYHEDNGEGLDNFHVGVSRGVGGLAAKIDSTYYISKNFIRWKTLYNGPIRTSFILEYANWSADGKTISEEKHISLDYGSNLSKFEVYIKGIDTISVGLTLHENDGEVKANMEESYLSYWQPHKNSALGTGIVTAKENIIAFEKYVSERKDESNAYAHLSLKKGKVIYYAGFGWKESQQFQNQEEWEAYLTLFSEKINNPLSVALVKK